MNVHHYFPKTSGGLNPEDFFIATWDTRNTSSGSSAADQVTLPFVSVGVYDVFVDWGDGSDEDRINVWDQAERTHTYLVQGVYTITIKPRVKDKLNGWAFANS